MDRVQASDARYALLQRWCALADDKRSTEKAQFERAVQRRWLRLDLPALAPQELPSSSIRPHEWARLLVHAGRENTFLLFCAARFTSHFVYAPDTRPERINVHNARAMYAAYVSEAWGARLPRVAEHAFHESTRYIVQVMLRLLPSRLLESSLHALCTAHGVLPQPQEWFVDLILTGVRWQRAANALFVRRPPFARLAQLFYLDPALQPIVDAIEASSVFDQVIQARLRNYHARELAPLVTALYARALEGRALDKPPWLVRLSELEALKPTVADPDLWDATVAETLADVLVAKSAHWRARM